MKKVFKVEQKRIKMFFNKKDSIDKQILYLMKKKILNVGRTPLKDNED